MSRLNTMYPDDEFLKNISDIMGKLDNKNETEIKQEIEQIGYKEFYRYYKEKDVYIKQLQQENEQLKDNWNKLKEYIKTEIPEDVFIDTEWFVSILDKMQELEQALDEIEKYMTNYIKVEDKNENVKVEFNELLTIIQRARGE